MNAVNIKQGNTLITGILLTLLGFLSLLVPIRGLSWFVMLLGLSLLVLGASDMVQYLVSDTDERSDWRLAKSIIGLMTGLWLMLDSGTSTLVLAVPYLFAVFVCTFGVTRIAEALSLRKRSVDWGYLLFFGIITTLLGVSLIFAPLVSAMFAMCTLSFLILGCGVFKITRYVHRQKAIKRRLRKQAVME